MSDRDPRIIDVMVIDNFEAGKSWTEQKGVKVIDVARADVVIGRVVYESGGEHWFVIKYRDNNPEDFRFLVVDASKEPA